MSEHQVIHDLITERNRQDRKWGGPDHDDTHSVAEFVQIITDYAGWARQMASKGSDAKARRRLIQVAALAVAAVETIDRAKDTGRAVIDRLEAQHTATLAVAARVLIAVSECPTADLPSYLEPTEENERLWSLAFAAGVLYAGLAGKAAYDELKAKEPGDG